MKDAPAFPSPERRRLRGEDYRWITPRPTEAAAVTSVEVVRVVSIADFSFRLDRQFVFLIRERYSGAILFMGKIMDPGAA